MEITNSLEALERIGSVRFVSYDNVFHTYKDCGCIKESFLHKEEYKVIEQELIQAEQNKAKAKAFDTLVSTTNMKLAVIDQYDSLVYAVIVDGGYVIELEDKEEYEILKKAGVK